MRMLSRKQIMIAAFWGLTAQASYCGLNGTTVSSVLTTQSAGGWSQTSAVVGPGVEFSRNFSGNDWGLTLDVADTSFTLRYVNKFPDTGQGAANAGLVSFNLRGFSGITNVVLANSNFGSGLGAVTFTATSITVPITSLIPPGGTEWSATWNFTHVPPPVTVGISNVASYNATAISPGEVVAIFVQGRGPANLVTAVLDRATGLVATSLAGTRVLFNNIPAPMVYTSATQLAAIVPFAMQNSTSAQVVVEYNGVQLPPVTMPVVPAVPGLFSANQSGTGQGAIQNENGSYNSAANPAARGSIVVLYGTGQGQTNPAGLDGRLAASPFAVPSGNLTITFGGIAVAPADILFKGPIPTIAEGFWQINVRLPAALGAGTYPVKVAIDGRASQDNLTLVIQ